MSRGNRQFTSVRSEGGLLPQDVLSRIQAGDKDLPGLTPESYHLGPHERIGEAVNRAWSRLTGAWRAFREALDKEPDTALATGLTRDRWLLPLFQELGYGRLPKVQAVEVEGKSFAVSHVWHLSPIHLLGAGVDLDRRQAGVAGAAKASPHGLVQEFLNRSEHHLWGFVSNGLRLRILRDHHSLTRQAYVEFDIQAIMEGEQYSEFLLLWMVCHQSRVEADKPEDSWLETWFNTSRDEGIRALDKLRGGVEKAIESFGTGFLANRANNKLREALESGELDKQEYYRQVLRLVYRLIFVFVAEERDALLDPDADDAAKNRYLRFYATRRLRELADKRRGGPHGDLWQGLRFVMSKLDDGCPELALPALGSRLWGPTACPWLMEAECGNEHLLDAVRRISTIEEGRTRYSVNWRNVGADELGSIYEGLLELHPRMNKEAGTFELETAAGHERKTTGSYYTPTELVDCLLDSALDPVLDEASKKPDAEAAILNLKVCDPASGSGHFLVAAARRIAKRLAAVRVGEDEPSPREVQRALRDVVGRCVYGVDLNPMAVELCKVSLWMEAIEPGRPLSFLDSHIQCGNALLGATPALMARGIPDEAFKALEGDDNEVAKALKRQNKTERGGQVTLFSYFASDRGTSSGRLSSQAAIVESEPDESIVAVRRKAADWDQLTRSPEFRDAWFQADAWCSAFMWPMAAGELEHAAITEGAWQRIQHDASDASQATKRTIRELARQHRFFHWHLAYPQVFGDVRSEFEDGDTTGWAGGFHVVLGNPPWEHVELKPKEFFVQRDPVIACVRTAAERDRAIRQLGDRNPRLLEEWQAAVRNTQGEKAFLLQSGRYPLCGSGRVNTYAVFCELGRLLLRASGRLGCIVPSGIAMDHGTRLFFGSLVSSRTLAQMYHFENEGGLFPGVHHAYRFCLLTVRGSPSEDPPEFVAYARAVTELRDPDRRYVLAPEDIDRLNPNTGTFPAFRRRTDADIARTIHSRASVLVRDDSPDGNPWEVVLRQNLVSMSSKDTLFHQAEALEAAGWVLNGNSFEHASSLRMLPLYEGRMISMYDHRAASVGVAVGARLRDATSEVTSADEHEDPAFVPIPRYWVEEKEVSSRLGDWDKAWMVAWRDITASNVWRTVVPAVIPRVGAADSCSLLLSAHPNCWLLGVILSSFVVDFAARQKVGGTHLRAHILKQLPVLEPEYFDQVCSWDKRETLTSWITPRFAELVVTSWDLTTLGEELGFRTPFRWQAARRRELMAELDGALFHLYGLHRAQVATVLDSFNVVRSYDIRDFGDFRTKAEVLDAYDRIAIALESGLPYQTLIDPPPADPRVAHPESTRPGWLPAPEPRPIDVPAMPGSIPAVDPRTEPALVVWAMVHAAGGSIPRLRLARALALRRHPGLLARLAPPDLGVKVEAWAARVAHRSGAPGTLAAALRTLADRDGIRLTTDTASRSVVTTSPHTPREDQLDAWFRFEARLALRVLAALPAAGLQEVDSTMSDADRALLLAEGA